MKQSHGLIGRDHDLRTVAALLVRDNTRLLTVTGTGGVGKTSLALACTESVRPHFTQVACVLLAPIGDPGFVIAAIAQAVEVRERDSRTLLDQISARLRDTKTLLLLDNFEHVLAAAADIAALLAACPLLTICVTSREPLRLPDEILYSVQPLALADPASQVPFEKLGEIAALDLFVRRARVVQPDFALTAETAPVVADICRQLDGLPLAIELAAVRLRVLTLLQIRERLGARLRLLTGGTDAASARQRTLRDTIGWSYDLLNPDEQRLFARLSVFAGGWTVAAAEAVCAGDGGEPTLDVLNGLDSLLDKNLIRRTTDSAGESRFTMLETIREYARMVLAESGDEAQSKACHALYFTHLAEEADPYLRSPQQALWLTRLQQEQNNLRAALDWTFSANVTQEDLPLGIRLAAALWFYWTLQAQLNEARTWIDKILRRYTPLSPDMRAQILPLVGNISWLHADGLIHAQFLSESAAIMRQTGDKKALGIALLYFGTLAFRQGAHEAGHKALEEAIEILVQTDALWFAGAAHYSLGQMELYRADNNYERAEEHIIESLNAGLTVGDPWAQFMVRDRLALIALLRRNYIQAAQGYLDNLQYAQTVRDELCMMWSVRGLGWVFGIVRRDEPAALFFGTAEALADRVSADRIRLLPHLQTRYQNYPCQRTKARLAAEKFAAIVARGRATPPEDLYNIAQAEGRAA